MHRSSAPSSREAPLLSWNAMNICRFCFPPPPRHQFRTPSTLRSLYSPCRLFSIRCNVPFPAEKTKFRRELQAAVDVVQRACRLCIEVKRLLLSNGDGGVVEKNDQTPVTIADFGVQALVSLELGNLFPSIPLVAEEDSSHLRTTFVEPDKNGNYGHSSLMDSILKAVTNNASCKSLSSDDVLQAIDRGGKSAHAFGSKPATYWVLDPIDGTRGFLRGTESLYVDLQTGKTVGRDHEQGEVHLLSALVVNVVTSVSRKSTAYQWHFWLGHPSPSRLHQTLPNISSFESFHCEACQLGKHIGSSFPSSLSQSSHSLFDLLHVNVWGPSWVSSRSKFHYYLVTVDDYSTVSWVFLLKGRSE